MKPNKTETTRRASVRSECSTRISAGDKDWTVMIYLAGDNDLSEHMARSLEDIRRASASLSFEEGGRMNVLTFFAGSSLTTPTSYFDFSDTHSGDAPHCRPLIEPAKKAGDSLLNFVRWCIADKTEGGRGRKARNYALILSGHSLAFHGNTFLRDESSGQYFTLAEMRRTLEKVNDLYLRDPNGSRLAILGFDTCVMGMAEVAYELKDVARTLVASEGSLPNSGWAYAPMLSSFAARIMQDPEGMQTAGIHAAAEALVRSFTDHYRGLAIGGGSIDISACDLDRIEPVVSTLNSLGASLNNLLADPAETFFRDLKRMLLQSHYDSQTYMSDQCVDIKDLCERLMDECGHTRSSAELDHLREKCSDVIGSVDACVLKCGFSADAYQFSNGLSAYFPWSRVALDLTDDRYRELRFVSGSEIGAERPMGPGKDWYSFLTRYVADITVRTGRRPLDKSVPPAATCGSIVHIPRVLNESAFLSADGPIGRSKDAPPFYKGHGPDSLYMAHFRRFKNFELDWRIAGFADDRAG